MILGFVETSELVVVPPQKILFRLLYLDEDAHEVIVDHQTDVLGIRRWMTDELIQPHGQRVAHQREIRVFRFEVELPDSNRIG